MTSLLAKRRGLGFAACALASSFWGCGFFFGKIALAEMNVGAMVFLPLPVRDRGSHSAAAAEPPGAEPA